jgi:hypothetical protein
MHQLQQKQQLQQQHFRQHLEDCSGFRMVEVEEEEEEEEEEGREGEGDVFCFTDGCDRTAGR